MKSEVVQYVQLRYVTLQEIVYRFTEAYALCILASDITFELEI